MKRTLGIREHFARDLAQHITKGLLEQMSKNDLLDGYSINETL